LARTSKHLRAAAEPAACYNHPHSFEEKKWGKRLKRKRESPISMEREEERREE